VSEEGEKELAKRYEQAWSWRVAKLIIMRKSMWQFSSLIPAPYDEEEEKKEDRTGILITSRGHTMTTDLARSYVSAKNVKQSCWTTRRLDQHDCFYRDKYLLSSFLLSSILVLPSLTLSLLLCVCVCVTTNLLLLFPGQHILRPAAS